MPALAWGEGFSETGKRSVLEPQGPSFANSNPSCMSVNWIMRLQVSLNNNLLFISAALVIFGGLAFYRWRQPIAWINASIAGLLLAQVILHFLG
jgi:hypothetical protein